MIGIGRTRQSALSQFFAFDICLDELADNDICRDKTVILVPIHICPLTTVWFWLWHGGVHTTDWCAILIEIACKISFIMRAVFAAGRFSAICADRFKKMPLVQPILLAPFR